MQKVLQSAFQCVYIYIYKYIYIYINICINKLIYIYIYIYQGQVSLTLIPLALVWSANIIGYLNLKKCIDK